MIFKSSKAWVFWQLTKKMWILSHFGHCTIPKTIPLTVDLIWCTLPSFLPLSLCLSLSQDLCVHLVAWSACGHRTREGDPLSAYFWNGYSSQAWGRLVLHPGLLRGWKLHWKGFFSISTPIWGATIVSHNAAWQQPPPHNFSYTTTRNISEWSCLFCCMCLT